jgi:hypothetical protein
MSLFDPLLSQRNHRVFVLVAAACALVMFLGCSKSKPKAFEEVTVASAPVAAGSAQPKLFKSVDNQVYLSWVEPAADSSYALRYSRLVKGDWSPPVTVAQGSNWFLNFADLPSMVTLTGGAIAGHWLQDNPRKPDTHDIQISISRDGGNSWSQPVKPHRIPRPTEYGLASMLPFTNDRLFIAWFDGRGRPQKTSLRMATVDEQGRVYNNSPIDDKVCGSCPTDAALLSNGLIVAYRDHSDRNFRDISVFRMIDGRKHAPEQVYPDAWRQMTCPVTGPAIDAIGQKVAVAWYTEPLEVRTIKIAFSQDGGERWARPIMVSDDRPAGRLDVAMMDDGSAIVCWVEKVGRHEEIRAQRIWPDGTKSPEAEAVTERLRGLSGCLPKMVRVGNDLYFAWTEPSEPTMVRTAVAKIKK